MFGVLENATLTLLVSRKFGLNNENMILFFSLLLNHNFTKISYKNDNTIGIVKIAANVVVLMIAAIVS